MKRVHAAMMTHVPSTVSRQAKAKGVDRIRHRDESKYSHPASHGALIAALPMAGSLLATLPTLLVYVSFGRYFIRGLLPGSVKG